ISDAFAAVKREAFLPPAPWLVFSAGDRKRTSDPADLYTDSLVALATGRGINNGEPALHARWLAAVNPQPGEHVTHVGAGGGYYTALLAHLVAPGGRVTAYEIEADIAEMARANLAEMPDVSVTCGDATAEGVPPADIVYVNAGLGAPPVRWLESLKPGGRMIFPWRPSAEIGVAVLVRRAGNGFAASVLMPSWFIPYAGDAGCRVAPTAREAQHIASIRVSANEPPDATALAICGDIWFGASPPGGS
nr:SAM-dependent methyltransferase [Rhizobiaceae bacterium]